MLRAVDWFMFFHFFARKSGDYLQFTNVQTLIQLEFFYYKKLSDLKFVNYFTNILLILNKIDKSIQTYNLCLEELQF